MVGGEVASKSAEGRILGEAGLNNGKSAPVKRPAQPPIRCPECGSSQMWKDGLRRTRSGAVQRYLCRSCGFRFSASSQLKVEVNVSGKSLELLEPSPNLAEKVVRDGDLTSQEPADGLSFLDREDVGSHIGTPTITTVGEDIYNSRHCNSKRRVCVTENGAKNLVATEAMGKQVAGEKADTRSLLFQYAWHLKKQGYAESTIETRVRLLKIMAKRGADLLDPESVKGTIANQDVWCNKRKMNAVDAYTAFLKMRGGTWEPPRYKFASKLPFIPTEAELDSLIAGCGPKTSTFNQLLKETAMRAGEAHKLRWTDIDFERGTIRVTPEKGSNPRIFKLSNKLLNMLSSVKTRNRVTDPNRIFAKDLRTVRRVFEKQRRNLARKLQNPRLLQIHFHTFRHWKATMLYHQTKDILYVMRFLGHKSIKNTLIYIQLEEAIFKEEDDGFVCKAAGTAEDAKPLIEAGFSYVCEFDGVKLFRRRK